jgi:hypothetical protein
MMCNWITVMCTKDTDMKQQQLWVKGDIGILESLDDK